MASFKAQSENGAIYEIEEYGYQLGRAWGIGQKGKNNGALLVVAPNEHRVRIEVGYGLEGTVTDAISRLIIENGILPRFRANDFAGGVQRGVDDLIQVLSGDAEDFQKRAVARDRGAASPQDLQGLIWIVLIVGLWLFLAFRSRHNGRGYRRGGMPCWTFGSEIIAARGEELDSDRSCGMAVAECGSGKALADWIGFRVWFSV